MKNFLALGLVLFLVGCSHHQPKQTVVKDIPHSTVYITPAGDKIIFLDDYYRLYFKEIQKNYTNRNRVYDKDVLDTIFSEYFTKCEYSELVRTKFSSPIRDTAALGSYIADINNNYKKIEELVTSALAESRKYLKNDSISVYILPCNSDIKNRTDGIGGVSGLAAGSKQIILTVDPEISKWKELFPFCIAREFEHTYWTKTNFNKSVQRSLLDYLVFEGKADSYAHVIYPDIAAPWTQVMPKEVETEMWKKIKSQLKNTDIAYQYEIMFGYKSEYVLWGGYTLGYHIMQSALRKHPGLTSVDWVNLPSEKILEMSDYK